MPTSMMRAVQVFGCSLCVWAAAAAQAAAADVVEIEEHWQLTVGGPDQDRSSPQVTMTMSPESHIDCGYFVVTLNHWSHPQFQPGGVQVQHWSGEDCLATSSAEVETPLHNNGETVSWVQRLTLADGVLTFEVVDGSSTSWGDFGGDNLKLTTETSLTRLNDYKPAISINESGIGYAGNRVSSLVLTKLRWKTAEGVEDELVAPIDIDSDLDP